MFEQALTLLIGVAAALWVRRSLRDAGGALVSVEPSVAALPPPRPDGPVEPTRRTLTLTGAVCLALLLAWLLGNAAIPGPIASIARAVVAGAFVAVLALLLPRGLSEGGRLRRTAAVIHLVLGLLLTLFEAPVLATAIVLVPTTWPTPWLRARTRFSARLLLLGAAVVTIFWGSPAWNAIESTGLTRGLIDFGAAVAVSTALVLGLKIVLTLPARLFDLLQLRQRLFVSYVLVAGVPAVLAIAFVAIVALALMSNYRASLATRLLLEDGPVRAAVDATVSDDYLPEILASPADERDVAFETLLAQHVGRDLADGGIDFALASLRHRADTTRVHLAVAPRTAPALVRRLDDIHSVAPYSGFLRVGDAIFVTYGHGGGNATHDWVVQACTRLDPRQTRAAGDLLELDVYAAFTDSVEIETSEGLNIKLDGTATWQRVASQDSTSFTPFGAFMGARYVDTWRVADTGRGASLVRSGGAVVVRTDFDRFRRTIEESLENPLNQALAAVVLLTGGLFAVVMIAALSTGSTIANRIAGSVSKLTRATRRLSQDDLEHRVELERGDELGELGRAFNRMADGLQERRRLITERERMLGELAVAAEIQRAMLPANLPDFEGLDMAGVSVPSREVGGDGYDFLAWGDQRVAVTIADVSGKGVPAALLMSNLQAAVRSHVHRTESLAFIVAELNDLICATTSPGRFITFFIGVMDVRTNALQYVNAGHNPPVLVTPNGESKLLQEGGVLLGALPGARYEAGTVRFAPGDFLVLYTDGVVEAQRESDEFFEEERLVAVLEDVQSRDSASRIRDRIVAAVRDFAGDHEQSDDVTVAVVRREGRLELDAPAPPTGA